MVQAHIKDKPQVIKPDRGICRESWVNDLKKNGTARLEYEFLNSKNGALLPPMVSPYGQNPQQFCSGNVVNYKGQAKMITASHCIKDHLRKPKGKASASTVKPQQGTIPFENYKKRIVAHLGGADGFEVDSENARGPHYRSDENDLTDSFRKNDYIVTDLKNYTPPNLNMLPQICDPKLVIDNSTKVVVIGYGLTDNGQLSKDPLCGEQKITKIENGLIAVSPYKKELSSACPGDSGGGLWALPKNATKPCMLGVVSGPKRSSLNPEQQTGEPLDECEQEGVIPLFTSVYQQIDGLSLSKPQQNQTPQLESPTAQ